MSATTNPFLRNLINAWTRAQSKGNHKLALDLAGCFWASDVKAAPEYPVIESILYWRDLQLSKRAA